MITLEPLDRAGVAWANAKVAEFHYLHTPVDSRSSVEGYGVLLPGIGRVGVLLFGRPEATCCYPWYGSVADVETGRAEVTRWQVLNLARVYFDPLVQKDGFLYSPEHLPGFYDRKGWWNSSLASTAIKLAAERIRVDYLLRRPPCFLNEPYQLKWILSYCDPRYHKGTLYYASGFERWERDTKDGKLVFRMPLPPLTAEEDAAVREASLHNPRSIAYRARRAQMSFSI